jgi:predicted component of type VI protein secretion system
MAQRVGFWRLLTGETHPSSPFEDPAEPVRADILRNLHNVLNARRGRIVAHEDFGLDDAEDLGTDDRKVADCIRRLVLKFEPRIDPNGLRVERVDSGGATVIYDGFIRQAFVIEGKMILPKGEKRPIHIRTTVVSDAAQIEGPIEAIDDEAAKHLLPRRVVVEPEDRP